MKKCYIAWILLLCLIPGIFINCHASNDKLTVNLLNAVDFYGFGSDQNSSIPLPSFTISGQDWFEVLWNTSIPFRCGSFVLGFYSSSPIDAIAFNGTLGSLIGSHGTYYQYLFVPQEDILIGEVSCKLAVRFTESDYNTFNIVSFYGYQTNFVNIETVDYELVREYQVRDHEMLQFSTIEDRVVSLPYEKEYYQLSWSGTPERLYYGISYVNIDPSDLGVEYLDSLQIQFSYTGTDYHSARLIDKTTGDTVTVLNYDYNHSSGYYFTTMQGMSGYEVNLYHTLMDIDLRGHDLDNCYIQIVFSQSALVWGATTENQEGFYVSVDWARAVYPVSDLPWYTVWGSWLKNVFANVIEILRDVEGSIVDGFTAITESLRQWFTDIGDQLDSIISSLAPDDSPGQLKMQHSAQQSQYLHKNQSLNQGNQTQALEQFQRKNSHHRIHLPYRPYHLQHPGHLNHQELKN